MASVTAVFQAHGLALVIWRERAAQGLAAPQGAATATPLMAAASAPEDNNVLVI